MHCLFSGATFGHLNSDSTAVVSNSGVADRLRGGRSGIDP